MGFKKFMVTALALTVLTGCASPVPVAENFPISTQKKARAVHHWDVMAGDVVAQTLKSVESYDFLRGRPLYVRAAGQEGGAFDTAFRNFIITGMVDYGLPVSPVPAGAVEVLYETQVVRHRSKRPDYYPGEFTALAGGVMVLRNASNWADPGGRAVAAGLGTAAAVDILRGRMATPTAHELVITTSIVADGMFVMRKSDVYYIEDSDASLFDGSAAKEWKVVGE